MRIANNFPALSAFTSLNRANKSLQKSINTLSTGLRLNSASDDAAGFAIADKMRSQLSGLDRAIQNSQDGVSLLQTAEGALGETNSMLLRMRELSLQACNDSLTSQDRQYLQLEIDELKKQIDKIAGTTQFNKKRILDGSSGALWSSSDLNVKAKINGGLTYVDQFGQKISSEGNYRIEVKAKPGQPQVQKSSIMSTYKTETFGQDENIPEEVIERVRTVRTTTTTRTEEVLVPEVITSEEPYIIWINGDDSNNTTIPPVDNAIDPVNENEIEEIRSKWYYDASSNALRITGNGVFNIVGRVDSNGNTIPTPTRILIDPGLTDVNIFLTDVHIESRTGPAMEINGSDVNVYLAGKNTLKGGGGEVAGIQCHNIARTGQNASITISSAEGDGNTSGELFAEGYMCGAGIGGACAYETVPGSVGNIIINGGTITAKSSPSWGGAGIGGGGCYDTGPGNARTPYDPHLNITINGGNITAIGGQSSWYGGGAGIGSGGESRYNDNAIDSITINGGTVNAQGGPGAAGIGGGRRSNSGNITVSENADVSASGYVDPEGDLADTDYAIGCGQGGFSNPNRDVVIFDDIDPNLRDGVPDKPQILEQSVVDVPEMRTYEVTSETISESTRTLRITPPPGFKNTIENLTLDPSRGVDSVTANGLPEGSYTVRTSNTPIQESVGITGSYGFTSSPDSLISIAAGTTDGLNMILNNANILFEVTDVQGDTVTLKATANLISPDGTTERRIVREGITLQEGNTTTLSGLGLAGTDIAYEIENLAPSATSISILKMGQFTRVI